MFVVTALILIVGVNAIKAGKFRTDVDETDDAQQETTDAVDKEDDKDDGEQEQAR